MAKLVGLLLATAPLGSNTEISKTTKCATLAKKWPTLSSTPKKYTKKVSLLAVFVPCPFKILFD
jgi:hypothetical protein